MNRTFELIVPQSASRYLDLELTLGRVQDAIALFQDRNSSWPDWAPEIMRQAADMLRMEAPAANGHRARSLGDYQFETGLRLAIKEVLPPGVTGERLVELLEWARANSHKLDAKAIKQLQMSVEALRAALGGEPAILTERELPWR